ncbi:MAG: PilZ domain-containing protein [Deltaproteobacteria bacterium]|nr:PilZ domain-containing protein [Deltaproteobacteria bacterium]
METQTVVEQQLPGISAQERRRYPRTLGHVDAVVRNKTGCERYVVRNLSVCGALLINGPRIDLNAIVEVDLQIPEHAQIRVMARVVRMGVHDGGVPYVGLEFLHSSDHTEDSIQAALLGEIERSQTHGIIPQLD